VKLRKGDPIIMIAGKDKGKTGKILEVNPKEQKIRVEGLCLVKRHQKANQQHRQGGILEKEAWFSLSKASFYDEKLGKATRLGFRVSKGKKERISKRSGNIIQVTK